MYDGLYVYATDEVSSVASSVAISRAVTRPSELPDPTIEPRGTISCESIEPVWARYLCFFEVRDQMTDADRGYPSVRFTK